AGTRLTLPSPPACGGRGKKKAMAGDLCEERHDLLQRAYQPFEEGLAVGAAEQRVGGVLGMRHQSENCAGLVEDAGDRARRAVEVCFLGTLTTRVAIAEGDEAMRFEPVERLGICRIIPVVMRDRHPDSLAGFIAAGKDRLI